MTITKPSIPKGTRDFCPKEMVRRNYIFQTIRHNFELFGFQPIETPAMENLSTLLGKYGEEGDKLLYRILNSGDFLSGISVEELDKLSSQTLSLKICDRGLRYDLTVPFARFIVQHRNDITFPFRRYQIQPVWRADRPQKGRYREFYQCDADMIGSDSLLNEAELIHLMDKIFIDLKINVCIIFNNRKILMGLVEKAGVPEKLNMVTNAIDKLEKAGKNWVINELRTIGLSESSISTILPLIHFKGTNNEKIEFLKTYLEGSKTGIEGINELEEVLTYTNIIPLQNRLDIDISLARGLNYYTGAIFEVKAQDISIGSICGGGRYDDLTGIFGMPGVSGVGISFGADRIYDVLDKLDKFNSVSKANTQVFFVNFGLEESLYSLKILQNLRDKGINAEIYPDALKMKKQLDYANANNIPFVILAGENEISKHSVTIKNMAMGTQKTMAVNDIYAYLKDQGI